MRRTATAMKSTGMSTIITRGMSIITTTKRAV